MGGVPAASRTVAPRQYTRHRSVMTPAVYQLSGLCAWGHGVDLRDPVEVSADALSDDLEPHGPEGQRASLLPRSSHPF